MQFEQLGLIEPLVRALTTKGYTTPTPIQQQAIPVILDRKDLLGCAQTGTGKTGAFALPTLQLLSATRKPGNGYRPIRALVLTPTRELAVQIDQSFREYGQFTGIRQEVVFGGVSQHAQTRALRNGTDVLIATPGRLLDLMNQGFVHLDHLEIFILDEADRMLDMGFIHDVKKLIRELPANRQTLFFSATMPPQIAQLADSLLHNPVRVEVTPESTTVEKIDQSVYMVSRDNKQLLLEHLLQESSIRRILVFTQTKHGADKIVRNLQRANIQADAIHGNKTQQARQKALQNFKSSRLKVLVATDIASRGIDVDNLTHVINFDLPTVPETYVHRIGRTGRAGAKGTAISFCDQQERDSLRAINKTTRQSIPVNEEHPFHLPGFHQAPYAARTGRSSNQPAGTFRPRRDLRIHRNGVNG